MIERNSTIVEWMAKNSEKVLDDLESAVEQVMVISKGMEKVKDSVLNNPSDKNTRKQLHITMKSVTTLSNIVRKLALANMVLVSGNTFKKDYSTNEPDLKDFNNIFGGIFK